MIRCAALCFCLALTSPVFAQAQHSLKMLKGEDNGIVPRYLLQMQPEQKHAVVVDTQKSRLYLYQNDNGTPRAFSSRAASRCRAGLTVAVQRKTDGALRITDIPCGTIAWSCG